MSDFIARRPVWSLVIIIAIGILAWLVFSVWTPGMEAMMGRKRVFLSALFNGITLGALYFLVASGFTLIFGLMRNVNLAHGSLYLFGGYVGYSIGTLTGSWLVALVAAFVIVAIVGVLMQVLLFRWMEGQDLRQTLVTIGLSIVFADLLLWNYGGDTFQVTTPDWLSGPVQLPFVVALRGNGDAVMMTYPFVRIAILIGAIVLGYLWIKATIDYADPETSYTGSALFGIGLPTVIGIGFLLLGVVLMVAWRFTGGGHPAFFGRRSFEAVDPDVATGRVVLEEDTAGAGTG